MPRSGCKRLIEVEREAQGWDAVADIAVVQAGVARIGIRSAQSGTLTLGHPDVEYAIYSEEVCFRSKPKWVGADSNRKALG
jgi:hypothetical protein